MGLLLSARFLPIYRLYRPMNDDDPRSKPAFSTDDTLDAAPGDRRREPVFTDFDEDENYEESERDTDYASAYEEELDEEDELEPLETDDPDSLALDWQVLGVAGGGDARSRDHDRNPWSVEDSAAPEDDDGDLDTGEPDSEPALELFEEEDEEEYEDPDYDGDDDWDDRDAAPEELEDFDEPDVTEQAQSWPLGMVIVGLVALGLLTAGGYGVIQQRAASQQEIRQLQASLATAASPAEVAASREALREMEERSARDQATIDTLTLENRRLSDTVAGLEKQLAAQQGAGSRPAPAKPAAVAKPTPAPAASKAAPRQAPAQAAKPTGASATQGGDWFVNFSSYSQRVAAEKWVKQLKPSVGKAVVIPGARDGETFYRVRIIGLADRAQAETVAGQLQSTYKLPPLWVGRE